MLLLILELSFFSGGSSLKLDINYSGFWKAFSCLNIWAVLNFECFFPFLPMENLFILFTMEDLIIYNQYGFRQISATTDCLVEIFDEITTALDMNHYALILFFDLSEAFDTVSHSV